MSTVGLTVIGEGSVDEETAVGMTDAAREMLWEYFRRMERMTRRAERYFEL